MKNTKNRKTINHLMLERVVAIHQKIKSGTYPNTAKLSRELEVSIPTISRDIEFLRDRFQAPIEYDSKKRGYYYIGDYDMPLNSVSVQDLFTLTTAKALLSQYEDSPLYKNLCETIELLNISQNTYNTEFIERIAVPPTPKVMINKDIWNLIYNAMQENHVIEFDYLARSNKKTKKRRVHAYQILFDEGRYFLFGYSEERKAERLFSLSRISNVEIQEEKFKLPKDYEFASRCGGGKFGAFISKDVKKYKIYFYGYSRNHIKDCLWADDQKIIDYDEDDTTEIQFSSSQSNKVLEWVLSHGAEAQPIAPKSFVKKWKEEIYAMLESIESIE